MEGKGVCLCAFALVLRPSRAFFNDPTLLEYHNYQTAFLGAISRNTFLVVDVAVYREIPLSSSLEPCERGSRKELFCSHTRNRRKKMGGSVWKLLDFENLEILTFP